MRCDEVRDKFTDLFEGTLLLRERDELTAHLADCPSCERAWREFTHVVNVFRSLPVVPVARDFSQQVMARVRAERVSPQHEWLKWLVPVVVSPRVAGAMAAAAVLIIAVVVGVDRLQISPPGAGTPVASARGVTPTSAPEATGISAGDDEIDSRRPSARLAPEPVESGVVRDEGLREPTVPEGALAARGRAARAARAGERSPRAAARVTEAEEASASLSAEGAAGPPGVPGMAGPPGPADMGTREFWGFGRANTGEGLPARSTGMSPGAAGPFGPGVRAGSGSPAPATAQPAVATPIRAQATSEAIQPTAPGAETEEGAVMGYDFRFEAVPVTFALEKVAKVSNATVVITTPLRGNVTTRMSNVTADMAIRRLASVADLVVTQPSPTTFVVLGQDGDAYLKTHSAETEVPILPAEPRRQE